jgi:hypothetical protein
MLLQLFSILIYFLNFVPGLSGCYFSVDFQVSTIFFVADVKDNYKKSVWQIDFLC